LKEIVAWVCDNKEWLFSGAGLLVIGWVGRLFSKKRYASSIQTIRSGDGSTNVQAGRDVSIFTKKKGNDVGEE
jgi:hypothetical protein